MPSVTWEPRLSEEAGGPRREVGGAALGWSCFGASDHGPVSFRRVGQSVNLPGKARCWGHDLRGSRQSGCLKPWSRPTPPPAWSFAPCGRGRRRRAAPAAETRREPCGGDGRRRRAVRGRDPLYATFVLAIAMGLRRGEVLSLRWSDVDLDDRVIRISNQVQRIGGELYQDTTKTGKIRPVPLPLICLLSAGTGSAKPTRQRSGAPSWTRPGSSSPPAPVAPSSRGISTARSPGSPPQPASAPSVSTTPGTAAPRCSPQPEWPRAS